MGITSNQMKANLSKARRSYAVPMDTQRIEHIKRCVRQGMSKKAITVLYGCDYSDIKEAMRC